MEGLSTNINTPGGEATLSSNPPTSAEVAVPHSDSGGGTLKPETTTKVEHLANVVVNTTSGRQGTGRSASSSTGLESNSQTDDGMSISSKGTIDSEVEKRLLGETAEAKVSEKKKRKPTKAQLSLKRYKNAKASLKKLLLRKPEDLSDKEKGYLVRNRKIVAEFERDNTVAPKMVTIDEELPGPSGSETGKSEKSAKLHRSNAVASFSSGKVLQLTSQKKAKRERSKEEEEKTAKKAKTSSLDHAPAECQMAIIDRSDLDGKMTNDKWEKVETRLLYAMASEQSGSIEEMSFEGASWHKGVKIIGCSGRKSVDFLSRVVEGLGELWPGAKLEVIPKANLPLRKLALLWIPPPLVEDEATMKLVSKQNGLDTSKWRIISSNKCPNGVGKDMVVTVDDESFAKLKDSKGSIKFGFSAAKVRLPNESKSGIEEAAGGAK